MAASITKAESSLLSGVGLAVELVEPPVLVVSVVVLVVESVVLVESPLLLQDQIAAADKQMAKENNFFFIKWFLCVEVQKIYASPLKENSSI